MQQDEIVQSLANATQRGIEQYQSLAQASRTRLVWFVGISGFALLNGKQLWDAISNNPLSGIDIFWLSLPWLLSVLFALTTHYLIDKAEIRFNKFFTNKLSLIELHKIQVTSGKDNIEEFTKIIYDEDPDIKKLKNSADRWISWVNRFETLTFASLVFGFIWSILFPLCLL